MESQSSPDRSSEERSDKMVKTIPCQVSSMSAQQILANSGNTNMLEGRTIHLNLFVQKRS